MYGRQHIHEDDDRSIPQLFADVTKDSTQIVRQEIRLARIEIGERMAAFRPAVALFAVAAAFALSALLILLIAASLALARVVQPPSLAAAVVGVAAGLVAVAALAVGAGLARRRHLAPERSRRSLRRDKELVQRHL